MILYEAIKYKYPDADPQKDFELRNDGDGSYINEWHLDVPKPTAEELKEWWEASQINPQYQPPLPLEFLAQEVAKEKLMRKQLEHQCDLLTNELKVLKSEILLYKGDSES
ncbi:MULTISPECIES: XkdW family protein [Bacillus]|uniref:XkdW family protein n=1 Tax=Bacillus TaxID=1386 RepID=UPI000541D30E|nr:MULTISPECIES: XkdW family protein [Bacillus]KWZ64732.1 phage portal protein [Bacillus altitudinis]MED1481885.1 XkdW family protein [Bacillus altitudinis]MEE3603737.1 XkdW family protein [Bacillus altitudinis]MEE3610735.1 XkdW family protein [Bacillus altitudinis]MEE3645476.1 XkdW family protein [Bacillus altitudinis]